MYSDWMDPVVNDDITAGLLDMVQRTVPPPVETPETPTASASATDTAPAPTQAPKTPAESKQGKSGSAPDAKVVAGLLNEADQARIAILAALNGGPNINGAMKDDNGAPVDLNQLAKSQGGISNQGGNGLNLPGGAGGPIQPGRGGGGLQSLHGGETGGASTAAGTATKVVPIGDVQAGSSSMSVPVNNAEAVIRSQIYAWRQALLPEGPRERPVPIGQARLVDQGRHRAARSTRRRRRSNSGLSAQVASCIATVGATCEVRPPGSSGSTISVPFNFLKQGGS